MHFLSLFFNEKLKKKKTNSVLPGFPWLSTSHILQQKKMVSRTSVGYFHQTFAEIGETHIHLKEYVVYTVDPLTISGVRDANHPCSWKFTYNYSWPISSVAHPGIQPTTDRSRGGGFVEDGLERVSQVAARPAVMNSTWKDPRSSEVLGGPLV